MSKANFYSNNIGNSKSLAVKIQNSINIPKGALIRVLPPSKYQTPESRYFAETHLKNIYRFYKQNGYEQYSSFNDFFSDLEKQNPDCIVKTYLTVYKGLKECSIYPYLKNTDRYIYKSIEEQNFIEEIIEETYYHVFYTLKDKLDVSKVRSLDQLRTYIKMAIKHKAHIDTLIIVNHLMKYGISYGDFTDSRWSLKRIANICGVTERTVQYRKKRIIKELTAIYNKEILPLLSD
jgi:hypothetical protein